MKCVLSLTMHHDANGMHYPENRVYILTIWSLFSSVAQSLKVRHVQQALQFCSANHAMVALEPWNLTNKYKNIY